jgi:UDP-N-acetylglucosamine--N-acetylmuramyl-(pentapeptide) pyrophosphoryl-undecaprenol N-acetylglucosamine transferase
VRIVAAKASDFRDKRLRTRACLRQENIINYVDTGTPMASHLRVVLTGGGTAGHVIPNIALIPGLKKCGCSLFYIASQYGIENELLDRVGLPVFRIKAGKFRRYFSARNVTDVFRICVGVGQSLFILRRIKADVVFSKGGYVSLPVVIAARALRIPIIVHESDFSVGIANRIGAWFARVICVTHEHTKLALSNRKRVVVTGLPLRDRLVCGDKLKGLEMCQFDKNIPVLLIFAGGLGSTRLNAVIEQALPHLSKRFQIAHVTGKTKQTPIVQAGYRQFEFVNEIEHLYACADVVIGRAGATTIAELLALKKPNVLIPLSTKVSRGDQIENALFASKGGLSQIILDHQLTAAVLVRCVHRAIRNDVVIRHVQSQPSEQLVTIICAVAAGKT